MNIEKEIKKIVIENGKTLTYLSKALERLKGKPYSVQNLSQKLKKGTINFNEINLILEELGYTLKIEEKK